MCTRIGDESPEDGPGLECCGVQEPLMCCACACAAMTSTCDCVSCNTNSASKLRRERAVLSSSSSSSDNWRLKRGGGAATSPFGPRDVEDAPSFARVDREEGFFLRRLAATGATASCSSDTAAAAGTP